MTDDRIALCQLVGKSSDADLLREMIGFAAERLMRNALAHAGKSGRRVISAFHRNRLRPGPCRRRQGQWRQVAHQVRRKVPKLAALLDEAEEDVLAYIAFPKEHWARIHSINPLERLNGEIKRRTEVVGRGGSRAPRAPQPGRDHALGRGDPARQNDEWAVQRARYMTLQTIAPLRDDLTLMLPAVAA